MATRKQAKSRRGPPASPTPGLDGNDHALKDLAAAKAKVSELLAQDRQKLLMKLPFTGSLVMRLDLVPVSDERLPTAATDGDRVFVDIDFYMSLNAAERLFVLAHEVWHCALLHFLRRGDRDPKRFNIAADLEIHFLLTDEGLEAPFVLPHNPRWKGLSAEEIYERLKTWKPQFTCGGRRGDTGEGKESEHIKGQGNGQGFDKHLEKKAPPGAMMKQTLRPSVRRSVSPSAHPTVRPSDRQTVRPLQRVAIRTTPPPSPPARRSGAASG